MTRTEKHKQTIINKYGTWDNFIEEMRKAGSKGGIQTRDSGQLINHGFAANRELAKIAGAKGGRISRRSK